VSAHQGQTRGKPSNRAQKELGERATSNERASQEGLDKGPAKNCLKGGKIVSKSQYFRGGRCAGKRRRGDSEIRRKRRAEAAGMASTGNRLLRREKKRCHNWGKKKEIPEGEKKELRSERPGLPPARRSPKKVRPSGN